MSAENFIPGVTASRALPNTYNFHAIAPCYRLGRSEPFPPAGSLRTLRRRGAASNPPALKALPYSGGFKAYRRGSPRLSRRLVLPWQDKPGTCDFQAEGLWEAGRVALLHTWECSRSFLYTSCAQRATYPWGGARLTITMTPGFASESRPPPAES